MISIKWIERSINAVSAGDYTWWRKHSKKRSDHKLRRQPLVLQDSVSVENALYSDTRVTQSVELNISTYRTSFLKVLEAAAVAVPDERLGEPWVLSSTPLIKPCLAEGELVAAVVFVKPEFRGEVTEESLLALAKTRFVMLQLPSCINVHMVEEASKIRCACDDKISRQTARFVVGRFLRSKH
jgi:acyl-CoA synthetase (AMP-forming)/AMP-acid ligase II